MTTPQLTTDLPDNLPVLTEKVGLEWEDELPLLTDVVVLARAENAVAQNENIEALEQISAEPFLPVDVIALEDELPLLQETISETMPIIATEPLAVIQPESRELTAEEIQLVAEQLQAQLESVFVQKLTEQLAQAQQQAIAHAVNEFKAELPELLRAALHAASHQ